MIVGAEDRQQRAGELRNELRHVHVAGQHHMRGADARMLVTTRLRTPAGIDLQHRRILEDARAGGFRRGGEPQRIVERMQAEAARIMQPVEIARRLQRLAHPLGRPRLDRRAEFAGQQRRLVRHRAGVVGFRHMQPAVLRTAPCPACRGRHCAHIRRPPRTAPTAPWPCSRPTRSISASAPTANPGSTTPVLRPDALQATLCASSTTTDQPSRATSRAAVRPGKPRADDADVDVELDGRAARRAGPSTRVAAYQFDP